MTGTRRVLAMDPSTRGFGFAVLEGPARLIDWGVKEARDNKHEKCLRLIEELIERYGPDVIVVEDYSAKGSRRCLRVQKLIKAILELALAKGISSRSFSHSKVRKAFYSFEAFTKHQIAITITQLFPELELRLPPFRKPWMSEDYRMSIFDAVALALTFFHFEKRIKKAA